MAIQTAKFISDSKHDHFADVQLL